MLEISVVCGLVVFVITFFLKELDGPFDILAKLRIKLIVYQELVWDIEVTKENFWAKLFECFWCLSSWVTVIVSVGVWLLIGFSLAWLPIVMIASIAIAGLINKFVML